MKTQNRSNRIRPVMVATLVTMTFAAMAAPALAQSEDEAQRQRVRARIEHALDGDANLDNALREQMRARLHECVESGLSTEDVEALFGPHGPNDATDPQARLRTQERVMAMHREGLPVDLVIEKFKEGSLKGAAGPRLEGALERVESQVRTVSQWMHQLQRDGVAEPENATVREQLRRGMTLDLWRGSEDADLEQLRTRAQKRLRDGSCSLTDVAAALETATQVRECGVDATRARNLAGDALENGYSAREIRQLGWMVMAAHTNGQNGGDVVDNFERGLHRQQQFQEMVQQMMRSGWMGPADGQRGQSGHRPVDDVIGGGPDNGRGQNGQGGQGGQGSNGGGNSGGGGSGS